MGKDEIIRRILNKKERSIDELVERARYIDIGDAALSIIQNYLSSTGIIGTFLSYGLKGLELGIKYLYFYRYYMDNYQNPLGLTILATSEIVRFFSPFMNLTATIPTYYLVAKREREVRGRHEEK
ncbi:hypothetical protein J7K74_00995 [Candidatus Woesearchaeota archaeon]|nr:hypothetical protein [Candidatus Woesearchaeota archaeon]